MESGPSGSGIEGRSDSGVLSGALYRWTNLSSTVAPSPRGSFAMTYDAGDGYAVLFGGAKGAEAFDDTWTFQNGTWTNITAGAGTLPAPRIAPALAYDAADGYVILAGGLNPQSHPFSDVWEFHAGTWSELSASGLPSALQTPCGIQATYDSTDGYVLFLAASCNSGPRGGVAYSYRAGTWTDLNPGASGPGGAPVPGYEGGTLADDPLLHGAVFYGGTDLYGKGAWAETSVFSAGNWTDETANLSGPPPAQVNPALAFDPSYSGLLLVGGWQPNATYDYQQPPTWVLNGTVWANVSSGASPPTGSGGGALVWDPGENASIWFGGPGNYTWAWGNLAPPTYPVTFTESGLVSGTQWSVDFNGTVSSSRTSEIVISAQAGTYAVSRPTAAGYEVVSGLPTIVVVRGEVGLAVNFALAVEAHFYVAGGNQTGTCDPLTENVRLIADPSGGVTPYNLTWSFGPNSSIAYGNSTLHTFGALGGNATLVVVDAAGYNSSITQTIGPPAPPGCPTPYPTRTTGGGNTGRVFGLPGNEGVAVLVAMFAVALGAAAIVIAWGRRRQAPPNLPR